MIYLAVMDQGLLYQEKVCPVHKALEFLLSCEDHQQIAILAGGMASSQLQRAGLNVNCTETLATQGPEARLYTYQPINLLLWQHRLYHHRLLIPAGALLTVALGFGLLFYYYTLEEVKVVVEKKVEQVQQVVIASPPNYLKNHASQVLVQLRPWLQASWLDFLTTCRLTAITLNGEELTYQGQWMDGLELGRQGCGNTRLQQVVQEKQLQLAKEDNGWRIYGIKLPVTAVDLPRTTTQQTLQKIKQMAQYLGWQLTVKNTKRHGEDRDIQLNLAADLFSQHMLAMLIEQLLVLPARMEQARLEFDPDNLNMARAEFDITIFTSEEDGP